MSRASEATERSTREEGDSARDGLVSSEHRAVEFLEELRFGDEPYCVHCGADDVYRMTRRDSDERNERYLWRCRDCDRQFTVRVGTIMEGSRVPLRAWCYALRAACQSDAGISASQIMRETGLSHASALFLMRRIRHGLKSNGEEYA